MDMPENPPLPSDRPDASGPDANRAIFDGYGFPGAPGLTHLCGQRVYLPNGEHLTWDAFTSEEEPAAVVAHYAEWLGKRGFEPDDAGAGGGRWRVPAGTPTRTLEIAAAGAAGPHTSCERKPAPEAKSIVTISRR